MKCQILLTGKNQKKNIIDLSLELVQRVLKIKSIILAQRLEKMGLRGYSTCSIDPD